MVNVAAKKVAAFYFDSKIEIKMLEMKQYGFKSHHHFKRPFPLGAFDFEVKPEIHKAAKRQGLQTFSEITEFQTGAIAALGILANVLFALAGYFVEFEKFADFNIYYAFFNMIPFLSLDGSKILMAGDTINLFGNKIIFVNRILWLAMAVIVSIGFVLTFFIK